MFMRTSFFKNFRKETEYTDHSDIHSVGRICVSPGKPSLWGSLDDSEASTSCDIDEDVYFPDETFSIHNSGTNESGKPISNSISGKDNFRKDIIRPNNGVDLRKGLITNPPEKVLKESEVNESRLLSSPPPSKFSLHACESQASPMLSFLKKKAITLKPTSPETKSEIRSVSPVISSAKCDVSSTAHFNDVTQSSPDTVHRMQTETKYEQVKSTLVENDEKMEFPNRFV
ncbi:hypothetical protein FGIG_07979 [Fasciola gigantica]|uniref:Uncharacterized protein n=1 Tax=Fasciola gigantica TaxID=46835 RepID=A0A504ZDD1_FASGI|nr:hypothetical protein FGIG_07979 [Fasciola gigantica]